MTFISQLTPWEVSVLRQLRDGGTLSVSRRGKRRVMGGTVPASSKVADGLESWGFITLTGGVYSLTDAGRAAVDTPAEVAR